MVEEVVSAIQSAEREAAKLVAEAKEKARAIQLEARQKAESITDAAEEEAQSLRRNFQMRGDSFGRKRGDALVKNRKKEFAVKVEAAEQKIDEAALLIVKRIG